MRFVMQQIENGLHRWLRAKRDERASFLSGTRISLGFFQTDDKDGMLCCVCCKHARRPRKSIFGKAVCTDVTCRTITRQALVKHGQSESHIEALKLQAALSSSRVDGGIDMTFERVASAERKAMLGALRCFYFLTKREIPHTTNFRPLCELAKALGAQYLQDLQHGGANSQYTFEHFKPRLWRKL